MARVLHGHRFSTRARVATKGQPYPPELGGIVGKEEVIVQLDPVVDVVDLGGARVLGQSMFRGTRRDH